MNIEDLRHGHTIKVKVLPIGQQTFKFAPKPNQELIIKNTDENELLIAWDSLDYPVYAKIESQLDHDNIVYRLNRGDPILGKVEAVQSGKELKEFWVEIRFLNGSSTFPSMELGLDDRILDQLSDRLNKPNISLDDAVEYLKGDFILQSPQNINASLAPLKGGRWIVIPSTQAEEITFTRFRLLGKNHAIDVKRQGDGEDQVLFVERLVWKQQNVQGNSREPLWLLHGELSFVDSTVAAQMKSGNFGILDKMVEGSNSYLNLWQNFQNLEIKKVTDSGRDLGSIPYSTCTRNHDADAWEFKLEGGDEVLTRLNNKISEMGGESVFEATTGDVNWDQMFLKKRAASHKSGKKFSGRCVSVSHKNRTILLQNSQDQRTKPPEKGSIYLSMIGDQVRLNRRQEAINKILIPDEGISTLGHLIEGKHVPMRRITAERPMTSIAKECFNGDPTDSQRKAVELALNTPDIAIIQGPPGTGKTRTIAAIVQRLNEISKNENQHEARYLLTSFQHDAVETVAEATQLMGLPAIKYGKKHGQSDRTTNTHIQRWISELIQQIEDDLPSSGDRPLARLLKEIMDIRWAYSTSPGTTDHTSKVLKNVADLISGILPNELSQRCLEESRNLTNRNPVEDFEVGLLRKAIVGLRVCSASFSDDGPRSAARLLRLKDPLSLGCADIQLLDKAATWDEDSEENPKFLDELQTLQKLLQDKVLESGATTQVVLAITSVAAILEEVEVAMIEKISQSPKEGPSAAFEDFIDRLQEEPESGISAIASYTRLLAATCQGSSSKRVIELIDQIKPMFDTVIIDEAARANPLDLLIPMSLARKRIILVGDHRQLPHLLEPDVEKELSSSVNEETEKMIRESLFQRLFETTQEAQRESGVQRSVTLDQQFRMHPELANLVSASFYAPHDEPYKSPSNEDFHNAFDHQLQGKEEGKRVIWRSVPNSISAEKKPHGGFSWSREIEAEYVAKEAKRILDSAPWLSVGIITFYGAQVNEIHRALQKEDISEYNEETDSISVTPNYSNFPPGQRNKHGDIERLRIGTVDAFQGKEFDVVILSPVRSNSLKISSEEPNQSIFRQKFGHLLLPNRLCVAMSRQRSLLVVVGDDAMFSPPLPSNDLKDHPVSGLPKLLSMCSTPIGLYSRFK